MQVGINTGKHEIDRICNNVESSKACVVMCNYVCLFMTEQGNGERSEARKHLLPRVKLQVRESRGGNGK